MPQEPKKALEKKSVDKSCGQDPEGSHSLINHGGNVSLEGEGGGRAGRECGVFITTKRHQCSPP